MKLISRFIQSIVIVITTFLLASCLSPVKSEQQNIYTLTAVPFYNSAKVNRRITLLVAPPETEIAYDTTQMAYTIMPYQMAYFGKNRWASTPSQMLQPLIVQTLQNSHRFHAVVIPPSLARYDYVLNTQISKIQQDFTVQPAMFNLVINAQLNRLIGGQVIATKQFIVNEPMPMNSPYGGVIAGNQATKIILRQIADFVIRNTR